MADRQITLMVVGAGDRGSTYASYAAKMPERAKVVAVAEPDEGRRKRFVEEHGIAARNVFTDWQDAAAGDNLADAVIVATQDALHVDPAVAFAAKGYDMLLEKPMAPTPDGCRAVHKAVKEAGIVFGVCHVLRYTSYTRKLKALVASGAIGEVVSMQHLEPVGYWHQAHSFVRGNWRNEAEASFMLLAKSCHDLDWIHHIMDAPCRRLSSFGSLKHFRSEHSPAGAADRCLDCSAESQCPYSAKRIYGGFLDKGAHGWPLNIVTRDFTREGLDAALREGPYGRCVYACDNDVVDHQVVNMEFVDGKTATFTMTAFTHTDWGRFTRVFGTRGQIDGDSSNITVYNFLTNEKTVIDTEATDGTITGGHGGGDGGIMDRFVSAVAQRKPGLMSTGADASLESHLMVFGAEQARREGRVVELSSS